MIQGKSEYGEGRAWVGDSGGLKKWVGIRSVDDARHSLENNGRKLGNYVVCGFGGRLSGGLLADMGHVFHLLDG